MKESVNYRLENVQIETGYQKEGDWLSGTIAKEVAIEVTDRIFTKIIPNKELVGGSGMTIIDGYHQLALPGLIEKHCHFDKSKLGVPWHPVTPAKSIVRRVEAEIPYLDSLELSLTERASHLIDLELPHGAITSRTHVDVEPTTNLRYFDEVRTLAQTKPFAVEIAVFPQHGLLRSDSVELANQALAKGVDFIGGVGPYSLDGDYRKSLAEIFRLADKHGVGVDIHLYDRRKIGTTTIKKVIRLAKEYGLQDKAFISHAFGLNDFIGKERAEVYDALTAEKIHVNSNMPITPNVIPPVMGLLYHGTNVHLGCGNIYGRWSPCSNGSLQERLARLGELFNVKDQDALTQLLGLVTGSVTALDEQGQASWPQVGTEATYLLTEVKCAAALVARQTPVEINVVRGTTLYQK